MSHMSEQDNLKTLSYGSTPLLCNNGEVIKTRKKWENLRDSQQEKAWDVALDRQRLGLRMKLFSIILRAASSSTLKIVQGFAVVVGSAGLLSLFPQILQKPDL